MNASSIEYTTEIDYFITNVEPSKVTPEWIVNPTFRTSSILQGYF